MKNLIKIETALARDGQSLISEHVLVLPNGKKHGIGAIGIGQSARQTFGGPLVEGPWAYAFGIASSIDANGYAAAERARLESEGKIHHVNHGDLIEVDGVVYRVDIVRRDFVELVAQ